MEDNIRCRLKGGTSTIGPFARWTPSNYQSPTIRPVCPPAMALSSFRDHLGQTPVVRKHGPMLIRHTWHLEAESNGDSQ